MTPKQIKSFKRTKELYYQVREGIITCENCIVSPHCNNNAKIREICAREIYNAECLLDVTKYDGNTFKEIAPLFGVTFKNKGLVLSYYNHLYYSDGEGGILYAESDDDNHTEWYLCDIDCFERRINIGESFSSEGDIIHIYNLG